MRQWADGTFDTLNPFSDKGVKAAGLGLIYDGLFAASPDEPSTQYGLIAECVSYPSDFSSVTFKLRPEAKFHDGTPITPEDVIFSFEQFKKVNPFYAFYYKNVAKAEKTGDHEVTFTFDVKGNRELPMIVGELTVVPKQYWEGKDANGKQRDLGETTRRAAAWLTAPTRSNPSIPAARSPTSAFPTTGPRICRSCKGQYNFDDLEFTYYPRPRAGIRGFQNRKARLLDREPGRRLGDAV